MVYYWIIVFTFFFGFLFWETPFLFPLKMLSVLIHELWHSLMAICFQVNWIQFHIFQDESARTIVKGDLPLIGFLITASSGYIGTIFTGSFFLRILLKKELISFYYFFFVGVLFIIPFFLIPPFSLGFYVALGWSFFLVILYGIYSQLGIYVFAIIQSFLIFYGFYDLFDFSRTPYESDAGIMYLFLEKHNIVSLQNPKILINFIALIWSSISFYIFYRFILVPIQGFSSKKESLDHHLDHIENTLASNSNQSDELFSENHIPVKEEIQNAQIYSENK